MTGLRRRAWVIATAALALTLAACGNAEERSLCRQYEDLQDAAAELEALDPETATAADALELVENVMVQLDQFQAASEGLYDQAVSNLNLALTELRQVTFDLGDEGLDVARPLMQESLVASVTAYNALQQRLDVVCGTD
jgi:HAMP domain-containing protein